MDREGPPLAPEVVVELHGPLGPITRWFCTPERLEELTAGWLLGEGRVEAASELAEIRAEPAAGRVTYAGPADGRGSIPRGAPRAPGIAAGLAARPDRLHAAFAAMFERAALRDRTGGLHTGALLVGTDILCVREDVSRHCVVDKLVGWAARENAGLDGAVLLLTGRISGAIAAKLARSSVAAAATMSIPTSLAAEIAAGAGVTLLGRARTGAPHLYRP